MMYRLLFLLILTATAASAQIYFGGPPVIVVRDSPQPVYFDPYFNRPKQNVQPVYYETTQKKTKGNKVTKKVTIKNQYGETVYKKSTTTTKKKKKKK